MKIKQLFAAAAVALSVSVMSSCGSTTGDKSALDGKELYSQGDYTGALNIFLEAEANGLKKFDEAELYSCIGNCYFQLADYKKSIDYQLKCLECDPEYFEGWVNLGIAYRKSGKKEKAMESYETALKYDPENNRSVPLYLSLGSLYIELGKPLSAIKYLERAQVLYPEKPDTYAYLSIAYAMAFEHGKSDSAFIKAQELGYPKIREIQEQLDKLS